MFTCCHDMPAVSANSKFEPGSHWRRSKLTPYFILSNRCSFHLLVQ